MSDEILLVLSTFPDAATARAIARELVNANLAACANILPAVHSIYRWEGKLEAADETLVFFKTTPTRFAELRAKIKMLHPYDVPEIIAIPITQGLPDYLRWVAENRA